MKTRHNYESFREHIVEVHPEILDSFEAGWNALGTERQQKWESFGHKFVPAWRSWAHVASEDIRDDLRETKAGLWDYESLIEFTAEKVTNLVASRLSHSGSLFGLPHIPGTEDIRTEITSLVAETIIRKEMCECSPPYYWLGYSWIPVFA